MLKKYLFLLFWSITILANSQIITITDIETNEPMRGVLISSDSLKTKSNQFGQADISNFKDSISFQSWGYTKIITTSESIKKNGFTVKMDISIIQLDDIVLTVSPTRIKPTPSQTPYKSTNITQKDIALQNPQTSADLLGSSGEVFIQKSQQGGGSPIIRGFSANRLLYSVDGVRMNSAIFRSGNLQNVISIDPLSVESTTVLFGPGSVLYGSDAIGGVMSFTTLEPTHSLDSNYYIRGNTLFRYSTANKENTGHFDLNVGTKKWAFLTSITHNDYDHLKMGTKGPEDYLRTSYIQRQDSIDVSVQNDDPLIQRPSGYTQLNLMQKIKFTPKKDLSFEYAFHYSETSNYGRYDRHNRTKNNLPRYGEWNYGPQTWLMNLLSITNDNKHKLFDHSVYKVAHQYFEEERITRNFNNPNRTTRTEQVNALSVNTDFIKTFKKHSLSYGTEIVLNIVQSTAIEKNILNNVSLETNPRYPNATWGSYAAYISDQYNFSKAFSIQAGVRYNQFNFNAQFDTSLFNLPFTDAKLNKSSVTGSIGAVYKTPSLWLFSTNISTGFRAPNIDDVGKVFDSEPGAVVVPNPNLKAEYVYNADLSITKIINKLTSLNLTGYYTILDNAFLRQDFQLNGQDSILYEGTISKVQALQNVAQSQVYGTQISLNIQPSKRIKLTSTFNYTVGIDDLGNGTTTPSRHATPWYGITKINYTKEKLTVVAFIAYSGKKKFEDLPLGEQTKIELYAKDKNGNPYSPSWYTANIKASYHFSTHWTISGGLENITDQRYRTYSSGLSAAGRNFILALKASF